MKFEPLVDVYNRLKESNQTIKETEQKLYMSYLKGEFNYTFNLKEIFYYLFGAFSLFFTIYLGIGWLIECAITKDVFLYHLMSGSNTTKFGFGIGVLFILPIGLFVANIYYRFTAFFIVFWSMHTLYFFKILNRKIDLKYNYTPNIFLSIFLWIYIIGFGFFSASLLVATVFSGTMFYGAISSLYFIICPFVAWFLKRTGIKWLWLVLLPEILIVFIECSANYIKNKKINEMSFLIDFNTALWNIIHSF